MPAIHSATDAARPPFAFSADDEATLDRVQRGAFNFMWHAVSPTTGMAVDRTSRPFASAAGVGFQLAALCIGAERGWVTRREAEQRALTIARALQANPDNRKHGLFYHFLRAEDAGPQTDGPEHAVSTIDTAILFAGLLVASSYFGGDCASIADRLVADADWKPFLAPPDAEPFYRGFISLGWRPTDPEKPTGDGALISYYWADSLCEHRLVTFLAAAEPDEAQLVDPLTYYRLRRGLGQYQDTGPMVFMPWSGALFVNVFSHLFIDYAAVGSDDPAARGVPNRPSVDWWENSRRAVNLHRLKAREQQGKVPTLGENAWGLTACDAPDGYAVPGVFPIAIDVDAWIPQFDYPIYTPTDNLAGGTVAPYGAAMAILFEPQAALAAIRYYKSLRAPDGSPLVWEDPARTFGARPGFGFRDSFQLPGPGSELTTPWVADDFVAIDQGPMLIAIENARTGLVWNLFHKHPAVQRAMMRLSLERRR
jgi:hypothetical protein